MGILTRMPIVAHVPGARPCRKASRAALLACLLMFLLPGVHGQPASREYDLKAVFLYNFAIFVEWPASALPAPEAPFVIGILGEDPFGSALDEVVAGERVKGRPLTVRRCRSLEEATGCHILFISASERERLDEVLAAVRNRPILTVGDMPRFVESGGVIGFTTAQRLQLHVNASAARAAQLTISSKLLRVATVREFAPPR